MLGRAERRPGCFLASFSLTTLRSSDADLNHIDLERASKDWAKRDVCLSAPTRSLLHDARSAVAETLDDKAVRARYRRRLCQRAGDQLLSFFVPGRTHSRHIVLRDKEHIVARRTVR